jgi:hypothetical protein
MELHAARYNSHFPCREFRWVFRENEDSWYVREPPDDWPKSDYDAARFKLGDPPEMELTDLSDWPSAELADRFFLAAPSGFGTPTTSDFVRASFHGRIAETDEDLYLQFASISSRPGSILECANRFGFLGVPRWQRLKFKSSDRLWREWYSDKNIKSQQPKLIDVHLESATSWLETLEGLRYFMRNWSKMGNQSVGKRTLLGGYTEWFEPDLNLHLEIDNETGGVLGHAVAQNLQDLLWTQWGLSVLADTRHSQCAQCEKFFSIQPGSGRANKQFCSDACRMKAYRLRKLSSAGKGKSARQRRR